MSYDDESRRREEQRREDQRREELRRDEQRREQQRWEDQRRQDEQRREQQRKDDIRRQEDQRRQDEERAREQRQQDDARALAKRQETTAHYDMVDDRRREHHRTLDARDAQTKRDNEAQIERQLSEDRKNRRAVADREQVSAQSAPYVQRVHAISKRGHDESSNAGSTGAVIGGVPAETMAVANERGAVRADRSSAAAQQVARSGVNVAGAAGAHAQSSGKGAFRTAFGIIAVMFAAAVGLTAYLGGFSPVPELGVKSELKTLPERPMTQQEVRAILLGTDRSAKSQFRLASSLAMSKNGLQFDDCLTAYFADKAFRNPTASSEFDPETLAAVKSLRELSQGLLAQCKVTIRTTNPKAPLSQLVNVQTKLWRNPNAFSALKG